MYTKTYPIISNLWTIGHGQRLLKCIDFFNYLKLPSNTSPTFSKHVEWIPSVTTQPSLLPYKHRVPGIVYASLPLL